MRKFLSVLAALILLALSANFSACSLLRGSGPSVVYQSYIELPQSSDEDAAAASVAGASVVTVLSGFTSSSGVIEYSHFSGIILNAEGYVLTCSAAAARSDGASCQVAYAVLPEIYGDSTRYRLRLVGADSSAGLAVFSFQDTFYHYTDAGQSAYAEGFQLYAALREAPVAMGETCLAVGNSLGDIFNADHSLASAANYIQQTVTRGNICALDDPDFGAVSFQDREYRYFAVSSPVSAEMLGGGLFDANGYLIGIPVHKLYLNDLSGRTTDSVARFSFVCDVSLICDFVDSVSEQNKQIIPLTIANDTDAPMEGYAE